MAENIFQQEGFRYVFNALGTASIICRKSSEDDSVIIAAINQAALNCQGISRIRAIGRKFANVFNTEGNADVINALKAALDQGQKTFIPARQYAGENVCAWREFTIAPLTSDSCIVEINSLDPRCVASLASDSVESNRRYSLLAEATLEGVWEWDIREDRVFLSDRWMKTLGYGFKELESSLDGWMRLIPGPHSTRIRQELLHSLQDESDTFQSEYPLVHRDGHLVWVLNRAIKFRDGEGVVSRVLGVHIDISRIKKAEQELSQKEEHTRLAMKAGKMGSWSGEVEDGSITSIFWSEEVEGLMGMEKGGFGGEVSDIAAAVHAEDRQRWVDNVEAFVAGKADHDIIFRVPSTSETNRWLHAIGKYFKDDNGDVYHLAGVVQDITQYKADQRKIEQAAVVFNNTMEGVLVTDLDACIIDFNSAAESISGFKRDEVLGRNPRIFQSGRHAKTFFVEMWSTLRSTGSWKGEVWNRKKDGTIYPSLLSINSILDDQSVLTGYVGVFSDVTWLKEAKDRLQFLANHDPLTGLPNRLLFDAILRKRLERPSRLQEGSNLAVIYFDLDNFKTVNDTAGHLQGDQLLRQVADRLIRRLRTCDTVARVGGDEFVILLDDLSSPDVASEIASKLRLCMQEPFIVGQERIYTTASMGIAVYPDNGATYLDLMNNADKALYKAKQLGRNTFRAYDSRIGESTELAASLTHEIGFAVDSGQIKLVYQPQICLATNRLIGFEALARWSHPVRGQIPPDVFIPIAEQTGLIHELGEFILRSACSQAREWLNSGLPLGYIAVNAAGSQIQHRGFSNVVEHMLDRYHLPAKFLELEVTESFMMKGIETAVEQLEYLKQAGVTTSIDDFGTGYSSLAYLQALPVSRIKLDQSFVSGLPDDANCLAVCDAVISMAKSLGLEVVAEGIENQSQARLLHSKGCAVGQGYYFSRPVAPEAAALMLADFASPLGEEIDQSTH
ncbi:bifunctional diguanylate cyclase/phosphodiesterase [Synechococcus sp. RSCCF101]|uniref:bifunctional diguanylate cyclase/phosphodiesterase n=1 Tax=Synechococcus sp. RSCCF101 TaxID=2511069 RepID=UPI00177C134B|nr:bifunctional diguanylate cyclase/phosphodiesterase [Synechococcus sp. RSCCF101]